MHEPSVNNGDPVHVGQDIDYSQIRQCIQSLSMRQATDFAGVVDAEQLAWKGLGTFDLTYVPDAMI